MPPLPSSHFFFSPPSFFLPSLLPCFSFCPAPPRGPLVGFVRRIAIIVCQSSTCSLDLEIKRHPYEASDRPVEVTVVSCPSGEAAHAGPSGSVAVLAEYFENPGIRDPPAKASPSSGASSDAVRSGARRRRGASPLCRRLLERHRRRGRSQERVAPLAELGFGRTWGADLAADGEPDPRRRSFGEPPFRTPAHFFDAR